MSTLNPFEPPPPENETGPRGETRARDDADHNTDTPKYTPRPVASKQRKWERVLRAFLEPGARWHRFSAARHLHDSVLPSTIAYLQSLGLSFDREEVTVPGYAGTEVRVMSYWLAERSRERAREVLGLGEGER